MLLEAGKAKEAMAAFEQSLCGHRSTPSVLGWPARPPLATSARRGHGIRN
jgi:hypothetical protein